MVALASSNLPAAAEVLAALAATVPDARTALIRMGDLALPFLANGARSGSVWAIDALLKVGSPWVIDELVKLLGTGPQRYRAAWHMGVLLKSLDVQDTIRFLDHRNDPGHRASLGLGRPAVRGRARAELRGRRHPRRRAAVRAGGCGAPAPWSSRDRLSCGCIRHLCASQSDRRNPAGPSRHAVGPAEARRERQSRSVRRADGQEGRCPIHPCRSADLSRRRPGPVVGDPVALRRCAACSPATSSAPQPRFGLRLVLALAGRPRSTFTHEAWGEAFEPRADRSFRKSRQYRAALRCLHCRRCRRRRGRARASRDA